MKAIITKDIYECDLVGKIVEVTPWKYGGYEILGIEILKASGENDEIDADYLYFIDVDCCEIIEDENQMCCSTFHGDIIKSATIGRDVIIGDIKTTEDKKKEIERVRDSVACNINMVNMHSPDLYVMEYGKEPVKVESKGMDKRMLDVAISVNESVREELRCPEGYNIVDWCKVVRQLADVAINVGKGE